ncbi:hypothetical protein [Haloarchaeobius sp. FL176]|uniref:hypothetical protein n=1 Tax=Haloarchaeobius sp. FL176 TaxID=2967129 RepID=UPI00214916BC|nr:hypothetical protein [Haloarchaeobius sp. FL176]
MTNAPSPFALWSRLARPVGALLSLAGVVHLLVPERLLALASTGYDIALDVAFSPRDGATTRVRLLGLAMLAAGAHLLYYGGVLPGRD